MEFKYLEKTIQQYYIMSATTRISSKQHTTILCKMDSYMLLRDHCINLPPFTETNFSIVIYYTDMLCNTFNVLLLRY